MRYELTKEQYKKYVAEMSPKSKTFRDCVIAFLVGGTICLIAEFISYELEKYGVEKETIKTALPIIMVFIGSFLTGINVYSKIGRFAGAGSMIPITGFANSIVSSAMEFKSEGLVTGLAVKMFTVAGPVIVYGSLVSVLIGIIYSIFV